MPFATVSQNRGTPVNINYEIHGTGEEKILFIMGFLTTLDGWKLQTEYLNKNHSSKYTFCVFDNRGIGQSDSPSFNYTSSDMATDAKELIDHLKWDKVHLVGVSMGGMIALEFASLFPQRLQSLSLCVTHAGGFGRVTPLYGMAKMLRSFALTDHPTRGRYIMPILYSEEYLEKTTLDGTNKNIEFLVNDYVEKVGKSKVPTLAAVVGHIRTVYTHHLTDRRLAAIKASGFPILIMCGDIDYMVRTSNSFLLRDHLAPAEFLQFKSGHCINVEYEIEFNEALVRNFNRGSGSSSDSSDSSSGLSNDQISPDTTTKQ
ncbi:hypothetical protein DFA_07947 [Cavenderia fasciculata]|uniref:AB hydrolase-1 domain-containing protein n=1 Tax=Cavenderia fasciculata TaxID=261658 RepID=F4Q4A4_CACFS|nr:uncharacterized protein DFA_07947 [Cavenderia fasciculata]EGG16966.1 hypothetical protein DFA_07947 [Cavenderia fasciculata]|eukprot:XP_004355440.1 hypothetical protein DFA_07947 [Cavenderia fasciculata]